MCWPGRVAQPRSTLPKSNGLTVSKEFNTRTSIIVLLTPTNPFINNSLRKI